MLNAYVPEKFNWAFRVSSMHYLMVNHFEPDVLVVRDAISKRFSVLANADRAQIGRDAFLDRFYFYAYLKAQLINTYVLQKDFGSVAVYQRVVPKDMRRSDLNWNNRMNRWAQRQVLDAAGAFAYMADLHESQGEKDEAQRLLELTKLAQGGLKAHLAHGHDLLAKGKIEDARAVFARIEVTIRAESDKQQAAAQLAIGRAFLQTGHMQEAVDRARQALTLNPDYREAHFDLGLFYVAADQMAQADEVYAGAVAQYGKDKRAAGLLQQFVKAGLAAEDAQKILAEHFGEGHAP